MDNAKSMKITERGMNTIFVKLSTTRVITNNVTELMEIAWNIFFASSTLVYFIIPA